MSIFFFDLVKKTKLVNPQKISPQPVRIEKCPFLQAKLAANHLVARGGVAVKADSPDVILLAGVDIQRESNGFLFFVKIERRIGKKVDVSGLAIKFFQIVKPLTKLAVTVKVARLEADNGFHQYLFHRGFYTHNFHTSHPVLRILLDLNTNEKPTYIPIGKRDGNSPGPQRLPEREGV